MQTADCATNPRQTIAVAAQAPAVPVDGQVDGATRRQHRILIDVKVAVGRKTVDIRVGRKKEVCAGGPEAQSAAMRLEQASRHALADMGMTDDQVARYLSNWRAEVALKLAIAVASCRTA